MKRIFLFISLLVLFLSCSEEKVRPESISNDSNSEIPVHESWGSKIIFSDEGKIKAVLFSDYLKKYELQKVTLLKSVRIDFYDNKQIKSTTLISDRGKVDDVTSNMYAIDNVVAVNDSGTVLKTSELMWRNEDQKIVTDKFVSIKSTKEIIEGYGLESDQQLHNYVIFNVTYSTAISNPER